jgi:hypothetical protein
MKYLFLILIFLAGCKTLQQDKRCRWKPDPGPCDAAIEKYYFDPVEKRCKAFTWGGCYGVVPFDFIEECIACSEDDT